MVMFTLHAEEVVVVVAQSDCSVVTSVVRNRGCRTYTQVETSSPV